MVEEKSVPDNKQPNNNENKAGQVNIRLELDDDIAQGVYANLAISSFTGEEFILDFGFLQPKIQKGKIRSRVILSPNNAKRLAIMLEKNIREYENKVGPITEETQPPGIRFSFN